MAIEDARQRAKPSQVEIITDLDPELGDVLGDPRRIRQVFDNLLSNALKCTDCGSISVTARRCNDTIKIDISDTGRGIAPAFLAHVFDPFSQAAAREAGGGLGLGLAIARQLVLLHGGTLSAASEGLGRGAQFTVTLPRSHGRVTNEPSAQSSSIAGVRVLIVDDDAKIVAPLELILRGAGACVMTAPSAAAGFAILEQGNIDILLSDIGMPDEDGFTFVRRLRSTPGALHRMPAIAITGRVSEESRERALAAGFNRYFPKPIDVPLLISSIAELVAPL
jgi:CheY-like chemotaxis protein